MTSLCSSTRTYDGRVNSSLQLVESLVNVDPQSLRLVLAVVVLAVAEQDLSKRGSGISREYNLGRSRLTSSYAMSHLGFEDISQVIFISKEYMNIFILNYYEYFRILLGKA